MMKTKTMKLKIGDMVKSTERYVWFYKKDAKGSKIVRISGDYAVVDNKKDWGAYFGDGVIALKDLELDINYYREKKLKRILNDNN